MNWPNFRGMTIARSRRLLILALLGLLGVAIASWLLSISLRLSAAASSPVDAIFMLGGSIRREMYVVQLRARSPALPILISRGSENPCVWLLFEQGNVPMERVWLEGCAKDTFGNFYYGIPILRRWGVHKVKMITSQTHLPRAQWLAQISFGAHGIWVETEVAPEEGVPGNSEAWVKTALDVTRGLFWAVGSQFFAPQCNKIVRLVDVDMEMWRRRGFKCEYQGRVGRWGDGEMGRWGKYFTTKDK
ncbi:MAG: YdcF family protein [Cyanobacteriota bacterium]|nr:YdcF family protein [Cyanobacteriota bacterium]